MSNEMRHKTDHQLLMICGHKSVIGPAKKEIRWRYPTEDSQPKQEYSQPRQPDPGKFFVGNYGSLEGVWAFRQNGKTTRAKLQGEKWEEFKRENPGWEKEGKE